MTINLFFILIHIEKRKKSLEEIEHEQYVEQLMEEVKNRQFKLYRGIWSNGSKKGEQTMTNHYIRTHLPTLRDTD